MQYFFVIWKALSLTVKKHTSKNTLRYIQINKRNPGHSEKYLCGRNYEGARTKDSKQLNKAVLTIMNWVAFNLRKSKEEEYIDTLLKSSD